MRRRPFSAAAVTLAAALTACVAGRSGAQPVQASAPQGNQEASMQPAAQRAEATGGLPLASVDDSEALAGARKWRDGLRVDGAAPHGLELLGAGRFGAFRFTHWRLGNGLQIVLLPDPTARLLAYHTFFRVGSAHEEIGHTGLAHLLEHLMFKGSKSYRAGTFDRVLERMGSSPNAATWLEWTMYHQTLLPEALAQVAAMEADRLLGLRLGKAGFESELDVVRSERREAVDNDPEGRLEELFARMLWGQGVGYGHPTLGRAKDLRGATLADVRAFYARWYQPATATVVLAGALEPAAALQTLVQAYGPLQTSVPAPALARVATGALRGGQREVSVDLGSERLLVGWRGLPGDHPDQAAVALLAEVLGNADAARWTHDLVDETRLAADVDVDALGLAGAGTFELRVRLRPGKRAEDALARVDAILTSMLGDAPITEAELAAARNRLRAERYASLAGVDGRAEVLGVAVASFGDPRVAEAWWRRVEAVDLATLRRVATSLLRGTPRAVLIGRARAATPAVEPRG